MGRPAYNEGNRVQGKRRNQAIIVLARRRTDLLFAMPREDTLYQDLTEPQIPSSVLLAV